MTGVVAVLGLSDKGDAVAAAFGGGGFLIAAALAVIPMKKVARRIAVAAGPIAAWTFFLVKSLYGLEALAWLIILAVGCTRLASRLPGGERTSRMPFRQTL